MVRQHILKGSFNNVCPLHHQVRNRQGQKINMAENKKIKKRSPSSYNHRKIPGGHSERDTDRRLDWLKIKTGMEYDNSSRNDPEDLKGIIENHIGYMSMPMAVAGPMHLKGQYAEGEFLVPLCTVEGTLAISMSRGMYASTLSGGINIRYMKQELSRAPVFIFEFITETAEFTAWVEEHYNEIKSVAESTTRFGKLLRIDKYPIQNYVILDMVMNTGNAAGQNMVTLASKAACDFIREKTGRKFFLESGFNSDKKASSRTMIMGRGHGVIAETILKKSVIKRVLGIHLDEVETYQKLGPTITSMAGTTGCHLHISNALTAIYIATGQDTACVAENSIGHFQTEATDEGLVCRLTLPSLTVGTVGGGTRLLPQQQNLKLLGCDTGEYSSRKLAEIIAASSLALEISLMSALASGSFSDAHMKYGRN